MKNFILFALIFFAANVTAQDFSVTPNPTVDFEIVNDGEVVGKAVIKNESSLTKEYIWERTVVSGCNNDLTWFCDPNLCYIPSVSTQTFQLEAGGEGPFELHATFSSPDQRELVVQIKVYEVGNESNVIDAMYEYTFNSCTTSTFDEAEISKIDLFPNPTTDNFTLTNVEKVDNIVIHNLLGSPLKQYLVTENTTYDIADLPSGVYLVQLYSNEGEVIGTKKVYKK